MVTPFSKLAGAYLSRGQNIELFFWLDSFFKIFHEVFIHVQDGECRSRKKVILREDHVFSKIDHIPKGNPKKVTLLASYFDEDRRSCPAVFTYRCVFS